MCNIDKEREDAKVGLQTAISALYKSNHKNEADLLVQMRNRYDKYVASIGKVRTNSRSLRNCAKKVKALIQKPTNDKVKALCPYMQNYIDKVLNRYITRI